MLRLVGGGYGYGGGTRPCSSSTQTLFGRPPSTSLSLSLSWLSTSRQGTLCQNISRHKHITPGTATRVLSRSFPVNSGKVHGGTVVGTIQTTATATAPTKTRPVCSSSLWTNVSGSSSFSGRHSGVITIIGGGNFYHHSHHYQKTLDFSTIVTVTATAPNDNPQPHHSLDPNDKIMNNDKSSTSNSNNYAENWDFMTREILGNATANDDDDDKNNNNNKASCILEARQVSQILVLLKALRSHASELLVQSQPQSQQSTDHATGTVITPAKRIETALLLLHRMAQHNYQHITNTTDTPQNVNTATATATTTTVAPPLLLVRQGVWSAVLMAWRDYVLNKLVAVAVDDDENSDIDNNVFCDNDESSVLRRNRQQQQQQHRRLPPELMPPQILERFQYYLDAQLLECHPSLYSIILHVQSKLLPNNNNDNHNNATIRNVPTVTTHHHHYQYFLRWAQEHVYQVMRRQSWDNPNNIQRHPDSSVIYHLLELCAAAVAETTQHQQQQQAVTTIAQAELYLQQLKDWYQACPRPALRPTPFVYCALMEVYSNASPAAIWTFQQQRQQQRGRGGALLRIQELMEEMKLECDPAELDRVAYSRACHAMALCHAGGDAAASAAADAARAVLDEMNRLYHVEQKLQFRPDDYAVSTVITAYGRARRIQDAQDVLQQQQQQQSQDTNTVPAAAFAGPSLICYSALIWAYARAGESHRAESTLLSLLQQQSHQTGASGDKSSISNINVWNGVLASWAESTSSPKDYGRSNSDDVDVDVDVDAPKYIQLVIDRLEEQLYQKARRSASLSHDNDNNDRTPKNVLRLPTMTYNILLSAYARQNTIKAARAAECLLCKMERNVKNAKGVGSTRPNAKSYFNVVQAWGNAGQPEQAERILRQLCDSHLEQQEQQRRQQQNQQELDNVLDDDGTDGRCSPLLSTNLLEPHPFNNVIHAWARKSHQGVPQSLERASAILEWMKEVNLSPNVTTYNSLLWAWAKASDQVLGKTDPSVPVENLYRQMKQQWQEHGNSSARPDSITFNAIFFSLARSSNPHALLRLDDVFAEMDQIGVKRTETIYNTVMNAWLKKGQADRIESLFQELKSSYEATGDVNLKPTVGTYVTRQLGWSKVGNPEMTAQVLKEWIASYESGDLKELPYTRAFSAVLHAWTKSGRPDAALKAEAGLRQMLQLAASGKYNCHPDVISYTAVISAYAKSIHLPDAGERALQLLKELKAHETSNTNTDTTTTTLVRPNLLSYAETIIALGRTPKDAAPRAAQDMMNLLQELQAKRFDAGFWTEMRTDHLLHKIKSAIHFSAFPNKEELMMQYGQLEAAIRSGK